MKILVFVLAMSCCSTPLLAARILALMPYVGKSHFDVFEPFFKELAARGHHVVVASHFPQRLPVANYSDISLEGSIEVTSTNRLDVEALTGIRTPFTFLSEIVKYFDACDKTLGFHKIQQLLKSEEKFDAVILEVFYADCYVACAHRLGAPLIGVSTSTLFPWANDRMGNPDNPSYIPAVLTGVSSRMSFADRLVNTVTNLMLRTFFAMQSFVVQRFTRNRLGPDVPSLSEITRNTSLMLVNRHFSLNWPNPSVPGVVEVGGIHVRPAKKLPEDLESYLKDAEHGVIYFSLGSMMRSDSLPARQRDALLQAFAELPQRVLWKWEAEDMPGRPKNVRTVHWLPQFDVLSHPNLVLFVCHGGMLSVIEAVHAGVPVLGIPMFGDQFMNVRAVEEAGMGLRLGFGDITKSSVLQALRTILETPSYKGNARRMAALYADRPMSAMDTAIFWTEYVIRHKGAPHLRSAATSLCWYEYLLLDVMFVILMTCVILCFILYNAFKIIVNMINKVKKYKQN